MCCALVYRSFGILHNKTAPKEEGKKHQKKKKYPIIQPHIKKVQIIGGMVDKSINQSYQIFYNI